MEVKYNNMLIHKITSRFQQGQFLLIQIYQHHQDQIEMEEYL